MAKVENGPEGQGQPQEEQGKWRKDFARIDQALAETRLVPRLHELFTQRGVEPEYLVIDGCEMSRGFPVTILTRYIMPVFSDNESQDVEELKGAYPGLAVSDVHGLGIRTVEVQIGLDREDLSKVAERGKIVIDREGEGFDVPPPWWTYPYKATDLSRDYNLAPDASYFGKGEAPEGGRLSLEAFIWGKAETDEKITSFVFEQEKKGVIARRDPWQEEQAHTKSGLKNMEAVIDSYLNKAK